MSFKTKKVPELELDEDYLQEARQHRYCLVNEPSGTPVNSTEKF